MDNVSDVRRRAWETRRAKYGLQGHEGSYARPCPRCKDMLELLIKLHHEGSATEGQVARATGLYRVEVRRLADDYRNSLPEPPEAA